MPIPALTNPFTIKGIMFHSELSPIRPEKKDIVFHRFFSHELSISSKRIGRLALKRTEMVGLRLLSFLQLLLFNLSFLNTFVFVVINSIKCFPDKQLIKAYFRDKM